MKRKFYKRKQGFMLIELSIALVVIGLLFAGISGGTALIENAKVRATLSQIESIKNASNMFNAEYGLPPGGLKNIQEYFLVSVDTGNKNICKRDASGADEVNGKGKREISGKNANGWVMSNIAMCQLHGGKYVDLPTGSSLSKNQITPGEHSPKVKLSGSSSIILITYGQDFSIILGDANDASWDGTAEKIKGNISGELLKKIDQKVSTGKYNTGSFLGQKMDSSVMTLAAAITTAKNKAIGNGYTQGQKDAAVAAAKAKFEAAVVCDYNSKTKKCRGVYKLLD